MQIWGRIGKASNILRKFFFRGSPPEKRTPHEEIDDKVAGDWVQTSTGSNQSLIQVKPKEKQADARISLEGFAFQHFAKKLPSLSNYEKKFAQSGIQMLYETYLSLAFFSSIITATSSFLISFFLEYEFFHASLISAGVASLFLSAFSLTITIALWLLIPLQKRHSMKDALESQLAYSIGLMGVLAASGISVEGLFEAIATSSNSPVLSGLAQRFVRNLKVFGMDTASAFKEIAAHSPSPKFTRIIEGILIAFQTTGSLHDLIMFESQKLFAEKKEKLRKNMSDISTMAEIYISLVVVGPIIFIVMFVIFALLPAKGGSLPPSSLMINVLVLIGIPVLSSGFAVALDAMIRKI